MVATSSGATAPSRVAEHVRNVRACRGACDPSEERGRISLPEDAGTSGSVHGDRPRIERGDDRLGEALLLALGAILRPGLPNHRVALDQERAGHGVIGLARMYQGLDWQRCSEDVIFDSC